MNPRIPRQALPAEAGAIARLVGRCVPRCLPVTAKEVADGIGNWFVIGPPGSPRAAASLESLPEGDLELRSVAVDPEWQGDGLGARVVRAACIEAQRRGRELLCVTTTPAFFQLQGFERAEDSRLPEKDARKELPLSARRHVMRRRVHFSGKEQRRGSLTCSA